MHGKVFASGEWLSPDGAQAWLPSGLGGRGPGSVAKVPCVCDGGKGSPCQEVCLPLPQALSRESIGRLGC